MGPGELLASGGHAEQGEDAEQERGRADCGDQVGSVVDAGEDVAEDHPDEPGGSGQADDVRNVGEEAPPQPAPQQHLEHPDADDRCEEAHMTGHPPGPRLVAPADPVVEPQDAIGEQERRHPQAGYMRQLDDGRTGLTHASRVDHIGIRTHRGRPGSRPSPTLRSSGRPQDWTSAANRCASRAAVSCTAGSAAVRSSTPRATRSSSP